MNSSVTQTQTQTKPITIPKSTPTYIIKTTSAKNTNTSTNSNQYSLKQNCFNPNNASPPSSWNFRLMQRISDEVPVMSL